MVDKGGMMVRFRNIHIIIVCVIVCVFLLVSSVTANQPIGEIGEPTKPTIEPTKPTPTPTPTKQPIEISDDPVYIEKSDTNITKVEPVTIKITSTDKTTWNSTICAYPNTKYLINSFKETKTIDYVAIPDSRDVSEYPLYEAYYNYGKSSLEPWGTYWRIIPSSLKQGKMVSMIYADFKTKSVKTVELSPIEWDYVKKDIDSGIVPDINVLEKYWGV